MKKRNLMVILSLSMQSAYGLAHDTKNILEQNQQDTAIPQLIETSNLDTADYIWKVKLDIDLQSRKINTQLLNPHQHFNQLNKRASEVAAEYVLQHDPKEIIQMKPITVSVIFPLGPKWIKPPDLTKSIKYMSAMCGFNPKLITWVNSKIYDKSKNAYYFEIALLADQHGNIIKMKNLNQSRLIKLNYYIDHEISEGRLYPYNQDGIPSTINIKQRFEVQCD